MKKTAILFVCLGNICRSPIAEAVMRSKVEAKGAADIIEIDSAGTASWHVGKAPDARMIEAGTGRGYDLKPLRARQVKPADFYEFDYILAMDEENLDDLMAMAPENPRARLSLYLDFAAGVRETEVPDPYYGGEDGFVHVIDLVENAADGFLKKLEDTSEITA